MKKSTDGSGGRRFRFPNLDEIKKEKARDVMEHVLKKHYDGPMNKDTILPLLCYGEKDEIIKMRSYVHVFGTKRHSAYLEELISKYGELNQQTVAKTVYEPFLVYTLEFFYAEKLLPDSLMIDIGEDKAFFHLDEDWPERDALILPKQLPEQQRKLVMKHLVKWIYSPLNPRWVSSLQDTLSMDKDEILRDVEVIDAQVKTSQRMDTKKIKTDTLNPSKAIKATGVKTFRDFVDRNSNNVKCTFVVGSRDFELKRHNPSTDIGEFRVIPGKLFTSILRQIGQEKCIQLKEHLAKRVKFNDGDYHDLYSASPALASPSEVIASTSSTESMEPEFITTSIRIPQSLKRKFDKLSEDGRRRVMENTTKDASKMLEYSLEHHILNECKQGQK